MLKQEELKETRTKMQMTQKEFASMIEVPYTTYVKWERGLRTMKPYTLAYINEVIEKHEQD